MSTRSLIYIKLCSRDKGTTNRHKEELLPNGVGYEGWEKKEDFPEVYIHKNTNYLGIYHHWDGYPEGVGETLVNTYNTYEKALNIILGGSMSTINGGVSSYFNRGEDWNTISPIQKKTKKLSVNPETWCDYVYLFDPDNNKWSVAPIVWNNKTKKSKIGEFKLVSDVLAERESE